MIQTTKSSKITSELSQKSVPKSVQPPLKLRSIRGKKGGVGGGEKECFSSPNFCVFLVVGILTPGKKNLATKDQKALLTLLAWLQFMQKSPTALDT